MNEQMNEHTDIHKLLYDMITEGNLEGIKNIFENSDKIEKPISGHTYTYEAIIKQEYNIFEYLIQYYDIDTVDEYGHTLLTEYLHHNLTGEIDASMEELSLILKHTKNIDVQNPLKFNNTTLNEMIYHYSTEIEDEIHNKKEKLKRRKIILLLLKHGADPFMITNRYSPVNLAIEHDNLELLYFILTFYVINKQGKINDSDMDLLLETEDVNSLEDILQSISNCDDDNLISTMLLDHIIKYDIKDLKFLHYLFYKLIDDDDIESIKILAPNVDISSMNEHNNDNVLCYALAEEKYEIFDYLAEIYHVDTPDENGVTTLMYMIEEVSMEPELISYLLKYVKNINAADFSDYNTALSLTILEVSKFTETSIETSSNIDDNKDTYLKTVSLLLEKGAYPTYNGTNVSPLIIALDISTSSNIRDELINMLLKYIPKNESIYEELSYCISNDKYDDLETLLPYATDINEDGDYGKLLQQAKYEEPNLDIIELLIGHGACL